MPEKSISDLLHNQLNNIPKEELISLILSFLEQEADMRKQFINHCAKESASSPEGWGIIMDKLFEIEEMKKVELEKEGAQKYLTNLKTFRDKCLQGEYAECADFDEKRYAYSYGDVYLEEFFDEFIGCNIGFEIYEDYLKIAYSHCNTENFAVAAEAFAYLIEIYERDISGPHVFVEDEDFPDADLSEFSSIDIAELKEKLEFCRRKVQE